VSRLDASVQTDPYEPRLDHQTECLSMRPLALIIIIFWFSRPLNLFRCWTNPWWSSSFRLVISPVISGRTIRDLHAHSKKSARRRWTHSRMSSRRWWWKTVSGQSSRSRICWRWGLNWGEKKECAQLPTVSEFWHVLDYLSDSFHQLWMYCCFSRARLYGVRGGSTG